MDGLASPAAHGKTLRFSCFLLATAILVAAPAFAGLNRRSAASPKGETSKASRPKCEELGPFSEWSEPVNLGPVVNYPGYRNTVPGISPDGLSLYFGSNRPGTLGDLDIYVSQRPSRDVPWGLPRNLGPTINTPFHEARPNISPDMHQLFFNSNRTDLGGCGGQDLYVSYREDVTDDFAWETPVNLGCTLNSLKVDQGPSYFEDEETGARILYFASDRAGSPGERNIYTSTLGEDGVWGPAGLVEELTTTFFDSRPNIRSDGLELFFFSTRPAKAAFNIWASTRPTTQDNWSEPSLVLEGAAYPSISSDGTTIYFAMLPPGNPNDNLYVATRHRLRK